VPALPLAAFILVQLGCLAVCFQGVPLAATVSDGEWLTLDVLLAGQVGGGAVLAAGLARTWASAAVAAATVWPALLLAAAVQAEPINNALTAAAGVTLWIGALAGWCGAVRSDAGRRTVAVAASIWSIGGAVLAYLAIEFVGDASVPPAAPFPLTHTPMLAAWHLGAGGDESAWWRLLHVGIALGLSVAVLAIRCYLGRRYRSGAPQKVGLDEVPPVPTKGSFRSL
jgi:hypothetical protein